MSTPFFQPVFTQISIKFIYLITQTYIIFSIYKYQLTNMQIEENNSAKFFKIIKNRYSEKQQLLSLSYYLNQWSEILQLKDWNSIKLLFLQRCRITDSNAKVISQLKFSKIRSLWLGFNQLKAKGIYTIFNQGWDYLENLKLNENKFGDEGLQILIKKELKNLRNLQLHFCQITYQGLSVMLSHNVSKITSLQLSRNNIGQKGVQILTKINLPDLENLFIQNCRIGTQGAIHLVKGNWSKLKYLNVSNNQITYDGYQSFCKNSWEKLEKIFIGQYRFSSGDYIVNAIQTMDFVLNMSKVETHKNIKNKKMNQKMQNILESKYKKIKIQNIASKKSQSRTTRAHQPAKQRQFKELSNLLVQKY